MDTRGETTVEIGAALLHHHSHLPRNHIYHVIGSVPLIASNRSQRFAAFSMTAFHSMRSMSKIANIGIS